MSLVERRRGICRTVYLVGPWAIKTPRLHVAADRRGNLDLSRGRWAVWSFTRGVLANQSECEWSGVEGVAPVLRSWLAGLVNVYPRMRPWPLPEDPPYDTIGPEWLPKDRKRQNIGLDRLDRPVWLDYDGSWNGCPHERAAHDLSEPDEPVMHDPDAPCDCARADRTDDHAFAPGCVEWDDDLHGD